MKRPPLADWLQKPVESYQNANTRRGWHYYRLMYWANPPWLTDSHREQMRSIRRKARRLGLEVDHIVPVKSPLVCGLNVPWNLQLLTPEQNRYKSNNMWPGHPFESHPLFDDPEPHQMRLL